MFPKYRINSRIWLLKDQNEAARHISQDDYFGTMATILNLWRQQIEKNPDIIGPDFYDKLAEIEKDLIWLQQNYQISPRIKKKKMIPKGKEISQ